MSDLILSSDLFFDKATYLEYLRVVELSNILKYGPSFVGSVGKGSETGLGFSAYLERVAVACTGDVKHGSGWLAGDGKSGEVPIVGAGDDGELDRTERCGGIKSNVDEAVGVDRQGVGFDAAVGGRSDGLRGNRSGNIDEAAAVKGVHYSKNKAKRERAKAFRRGVKDLKDVCPSLTGSVCTVDTRTAEEIEAVKTLAARRVVENKVAKRMAELKLASLNNKDKTDAVLRLEAARMEQRINEAKAKSQASFKECDTSLKSLGSTGSAGEFALKQEVKRGRDNEIRLKYAQLQNDYMIKHVPEHVRQVILDMPEPVFEHDAEVFGECPEDYDDEQRMAYDIEMNSRAAGVLY